MNNDIGYVYLIQANHNNVITYKIGKTTRRADNRKNEANTYNAGELQVIYEYESNNINALENSIKNHYEFCHIKGEWFSEDLDITTFVPTCKKYDSALNSLKQHDNPFL